MSTILQDMMGMLRRNGTVVPKADNYMTLARYPNPQERLKPAPKLQTELVTLAQLKTFFSTGGDKQTLSIAGQVLSLTNGGSVTLPDVYVNSAVFNGATDFLTLTRVGGTPIQIDMNRADVNEFINFTALTAIVGSTVLLSTEIKGQLVIITNSGSNGNATVQLPAIDEVWRFRKIILTTDGTTTVNKTCTLVADGSALINGNASFLLEAEYASVTLWADGTNWIVLSSSQVAVK